MEEMTKTYWHDCRSDFVSAEEEEEEVEEEREHPPFFFSFSLFAIQSAKSGVSLQRARRRRGSQCASSTSCGPDASEEEGKKKSEVSDLREVKDKERLPLSGIVRLVPHIDKESRPASNVTVL